MLSESILRLRALPEPVRFCIVGGIACVVDGAVLTAILAFVPSAVLAARIPSFLVAATAAWWMHRTFTFHAAPREGPLPRQWGAFVTTNAVGSLFNLGLYAALVAIAGWHPLAALVVASIAAAAINYFASRRFVFGARRG